MTGDTPNNLGKEVHYVLLNQLEPWETMKRCLFKLGGYTLPNEMVLLLANLIMEIVVTTCIHMEYIDQVLT